MISDRDHQNIAKEGGPMNGADVFADVETHMNPSLSSAKMDHEKHEHFKMLAQKVLGNSSLKLSTDQVDETLSQWRQVNEYIHQERMQQHERFKVMERNKMVSLYLSLLFTAGLLAVVLFFKEEYFAEVLAAIFGFSGGYGLAKHRAQQTKTAILPQVD